MFVIKCTEAYSKHCDAILNHYKTGNMTGILGKLKWKSTKKRRMDNRHILLYKDLKGKARIPIDGLIPKPGVACRRPWGNSLSLSLSLSTQTTRILKV